MKPDSIEHIIINNVRFPVWHYGNSKNPSIIVLHGHPIPFCHYGEDFPVTYLKDKYYFTAFDLPGYGYANELKEDSNIVIDEVIKHCAPKHKHIIFGTSFGGLTAIKYSNYHSEHLKGLIIAGMPYFNKIFIKVISILLSMMGKKDLSLVLKKFKYLNNNTLGNIKVPTLLLYSNQDKLATYGMGKKVKNKIINSELFLVKDRPHSSLLAKSDQNGAVEIIKIFVDSLNN